MADHGAGLSLAVLSALFNGSFVSFSKFEAAKIVHPFVFNLYLAVGVFISSCTVIPFMSLLGSPPLICILGVLAGLLLAAATSLSFIAVSSIGVSSGQGIFGAAAILVSFLWGHSWTCSNWRASRLHAAQPASYGVVAIGSGWHRELRSHRPLRVWSA